MNNIEELVSHGISQKTAENMISDYKRKIGTMNGIYEVMDIEYDFNQKARIITLKCSGCGRIIQRTMITRRNKWSELIKTCSDCEKNKKKCETEIFEKKKKDSIISEIGKTYGDYVVSNIDFGKINKLIMRCTECGSEIKVSYNALKSKQWKDNRCHKHYVPDVKYDESYIGKRYGFLKVIGISCEYGQKRKFICKCKCGNIKLIRPVEFVNGAHKSCGCSTNEFRRENAKKHGYSGKRLYRVYRGMIERCENPKSESYNNYGGRGISICSEWRGENGIGNFFTWAYSTGYNENALFGECTIDRIDVNGDYEPSNCRWITNVEQQKNKRPSSEWKERTVKKRVFINLNGKEISKIDLCEQYGISVPTFDYRIKIKGMSVEEALNTPKLTVGRPKVKQSILKVAT